MDHGSSSFRFSACGTNDHVVSHSGAWAFWYSLISVERYDEARRALYTTMRCEMYSTLSAKPDILDLAYTIMDNAQ